MGSCTCGLPLHCAADLRQLPPMISWMQARAILDMRRSRTCRKTQVPPYRANATRTLPRRTQMVTSSRVLTRDGCRLVQGYMGPVFQVALTGSPPPRPHERSTFVFVGGCPRQRRILHRTAQNRALVVVFLGLIRGGLRPAATTRADDE